MLAHEVTLNLGNVAKQFCPSFHLSSEGSIGLKTCSHKMFVRCPYTSLFIYEGCSTLHDLQATLENQSLYVELLQEMAPGMKLKLFKSKLLSIIDYFNI